MKEYLKDIRYIINSAMKSIAFSGSILNSGCFKKGFFFSKTLKLKGTFCFNEGSHLCFVNTRFQINIRSVVCFYIILVKKRVVC